MKKQEYYPLLVSCDKCGVSQPLGSFEYVLDYVAAVICVNCGHRHTNLEELRAYAKQTRNYN